MDGEDEEAEEEEEAEEAEEELQLFLAAAVLFIKLESQQSLNSLTSF